MREDAQVLEHKGGFDEVDGELVEEGLCEDELVGRRNGTRTQIYGLHTLSMFERRCSAAFSSLAEVMSRPYSGRLISVLQPQSGLNVGSPAPTTAVMPIDIS